MEVNKILQGDSLGVLKTLPDESVDMCITSPPYWALRDYGTATWEGGDENCDHKITTRLKPAKSTLTGGKDTILKSEGFPKEVCPKCGAKRIDKQLGLEPTFQEYISKLCNIFDEVKRVLKKEGTCWVNLGDTYSSNQVSGKRKFGNEEFNKNRPSRDKAMIYPGRKTGNIQEKSLMQIPERFSIEMVNRGWILRNTIIWHKKNAMPSSVLDRFTNKYERIFFFVKNKKYYFDSDSIRVPFETDEKRPDGITRNREYEYEGKYNTKKGSKTRELEEQAKDFGNRRPPQASGKYERNPLGKNKGDVWTLTLEPYPEAHFAVYPEKLVVDPIKAGCPKDGIVLDIFMGSGTTAKVARYLGRKYLGIELNKEYIKLAEKRLAQQTLI